VAKHSISSVVRAILSENIDLSADEVIARAKARGLNAPDKSIRTLAHNIKSDLKRGRIKPVLAAAARQTPAPKPAATPKPARVPQSSAAPAPAGLSAVLANVALVSNVVGAAGGVEPARQVAEAVRACGGVDQFLQHLDLVASIRTAGSA
jgi:hypothetical protein